MGMGLNTKEAGTESWKQPGSQMIMELPCPRRHMVKNLPANIGDRGWIPGPRRSPGEGNGNPFQYSCQENPKGREVWQSIVHGVTKSRTELSD